MRLFQVILLTGSFLVLCCSLANAAQTPGVIIEGTQSRVPIFIPGTSEEVEEEVRETLKAAQEEIESLCSIPVSERNESNTIIRLDEILSDMERHLLKYETLSGLYPDPGLRAAAGEAALKRTKYVSTISANDTLFTCIRDTKPESAYPTWLYNEELSFFRRGGAGLSHEEKESRKALYRELESLHRQYVTGTRDNNPVSENLLILNQAGIIRKEIASQEGYRSWINLMAEERGWVMNASEVSDFLNTTATEVKEQIKPVIDELRSLKSTGKPGGEVLYDYEIETLIQKASSKNRQPARNAEIYPAEVAVNQSLKGISCLLGLTTSHIPLTSVYAPDVSLYQVTDMESNQMLGFVYLDLYERPGKDPGWMTSLISPGGSHDEIDLVQPFPVFIVSGNLRNIPGNTPLRDEELKLLFHELGHLYTRMLILNANATDLPVLPPIELTEVSSKLFELMAESPEFRSYLAYSESGGLRRIDILTSGPGILRHNPDSPANLWTLTMDVIIALLDNRIAESSGDIRFGEWYSEIYSNITGVRVTDQGGFLLEQPHFSGNNAGTYWMYPLGDVYGSRIFNVFQKFGIFNRTIWKKYRELVLTPQNPDLTPRERLNRFTTGMQDMKQMIPDPGHVPGKNPDLHYVPRCLMDESGINQDTGFDSSVRTSP